MLPALILLVDNPLLAGVLCAGVLAAVMSSLDSQTLALSEMFTTDILVHYGGEDRFDDRTQVALARGFAVAVLAVTWWLSLYPVRLLFDVGVWTFTGFSGLFPIAIGALFWRRCTKWGVLASAAAVAATMAYYLNLAYLPEGGFKPFVPALPHGPTAGDVLNSVPVFDPVAVVVGVGALVLVVVSYATPAPPAEVVNRYLPRSGARLQPEAA